MKRIKKGLVYALTGSILLGNISPAFAYTYEDSIADVEYTDVIDNATSNTTVYAELGSEFKVIIPKHIVLDGALKKGAYTVSVEGDIAGTEVVSVVPDESFALSSTNLNDVTASISQDKTKWSYDEILEDSNILGNGAINASDITAGSWNGNFNFNIFLDGATTSIKVEAKDSEGNDLNASAVDINGSEKEALLDKLVESNLIESVDEVDALIEVKSDEFDGIAETTFDVSSIAKEGEKVVILHFDEEKQEWEYIGTEIVDSNGLITGDFTSYSPVAFVKVNEDGTFDSHEHKYTETITVPATCTETGLKTFTCYCGNSYTEEIEVLEHNWETEFTVDKNAICTEAGSKSIHCVDCSATKDVTEIETLGHTYGQWEEVENPDCTNAGSKQRICDVCGYTDTESISALGHNYEAVVTAPTCTDEGYTTHTCSRCNDSYVDSKVSATEHDFVSSVTTEATCTEAGNTHYECNNCDYAYDEVIDAIGHIYDVTKYVTDTPATCTTAGSKSVHCNVCSAKITGTEVEISATGHNYTDGSCTKCGVTQEAGLYDANGVMLCTWEESGIDVEKDYAWFFFSSNYYQTTTTSGYYVLKNNYPTTTQVVLPNSVTKIGNSAFDCCSSLTSITIPDSVTSIGNYAFQECKGLTSITIPDSVTSIGTYAFNYCKGLTNITIPDSVTSIGTYAFYDCPSLTSVTIGNSVTSIGNYAFADCTGLTSITVSEGNTTYDSRNNCNAIIETATNTLIAGCQNTVIPDSVTSIGEDAFYNCKGLTEITIPDSVTSIGEDAFRYCRGLTSITIGNSVTSIGTSAFYQCTSLTSITIGSSVTSIGNYAFYDCDKLTSITIPESVTSIGTSAFSGCTKLTSVTFEDTSTWYVGSYAGTTTTQVDVTDASTNVTYLKDTYKSQYWTKK